MSNFVDIINLLDCPEVYGFLKLEAFLKLRVRSRFQSLPSDSMALLRLVSCDGLEVDLIEKQDYS